MAKVIVHPATEPEALAISVLLAPEQAKLITQLGDATTKDAVLRSFEGSELKWSARVHGRLVAVYGVYPLEKGCGFPWLYATPEIVKYPAEAFMTAHSAIAAMHGVYPRLYGLVDGRFERSVTFARHLGFVIGSYPAEPPFLTIERKVA